MTTYTYSDYLYSDIHKDAYGFRPSSSAFECWEGMTADEKQAEWVYMQMLIERQIAEAKADEAAAIADFESLVRETIEAGAADRFTAIRWILDAEHDEDGWFDRSMYEYQSGLPSGYLRLADPIQRW